MVIILSTINDRAFVRDIREIGVWKYTKPVQKDTILPIFFTDWLIECH